MIVSLRNVSVGVDADVVQEGGRDAIAPETCYPGGQKSLALLAAVAEAEIPA